MTLLLFLEAMALVEGVKKKNIEFMAILVWCERDE